MGIVYLSMESLQGKLLMASPRLADPNFFRCVVLMLQHNDEGAMGLILNRPLKTTVREACEDSMVEDCGVEGVLHQGGPCEGPLMVLHGNEMEKDADVMPGVFFTTERSKIESLLRQAPLRARYFVGYAGWGPGQLESELEVESWVILPAEPDYVYESSARLWSKLMASRMMGQNIDPEQIPDDPSVN